MPLTTPITDFGPGTSLLPFAADTEPFLRVYPNASGQWAIAGADRKGDAFCYPTGVDVSVDAEGTAYVFGQYPAMLKASEAITAGNVVWAAADGEIAASGSVPVGTALQSATADGDIILVLPFVGPVTLCFKHTVTAAEDTANSAAIATGLGALLDADHCVVETRSSAGAVRAGNTVTASAGTLTVANSNLAENDVITAMVSISAADV